MKTYSTRELSRLLSAYLDGVIEAHEQAELEEYLAAHPEAQKELQDLRQVKHLLAAQKHVAPNPFFWTALSAHMESDAAEEQNLLPFPRRYIPLASAMAILAFVAVGVTIFLQREPLMEYLSKQSQAVKEAYESSILKGSVFPLFANIDNDKVLQYALFGTLPLDAKSETALRVDQQSEQGYHIEVGMTADKLPPPVTVRDLYQEVLPTTEQKKQIDAVLDRAKARIVKGAFYSENNALAVDPELTNLNRVVLSNIAAVLAPVQRKRLDRFLVKTNASYALTEDGLPPAPESNRAPQVFHEGKPRHEFVVITEDSTMVTRLSLNIDSLIESMAIVAPEVPTGLPARLEHLMKVRHERIGVGGAAPRTPMPPLRTSGEEDFFKVEISPRFFPDAESMRVWVSPRLKKEKMFRFEYRVGGTGARVESSGAIEFDMENMDSLVRVMTGEQMKRMEEIRKSRIRPKVKVYSAPRAVQSGDTTKPD